MQQKYIFLVTICLFLFGFGTSLLLVKFPFIKSIKFSNRLTYKIPNSIQQINSMKLYGRAAKVEEKEASGSMADQGDGDGDDDNNNPSLPFTGVIGMQGGNLYENPLDVYDPTKDLMDVPGEDGSAEQAAAMQAKIQRRVAELKRTGEWDRANEEFGKDPLANVPMGNAMVSMLKTAKPFERWDEFALTYFIVLGGSAILMAYVVTIGGGIDTFIEWFVKTDFDSDILSSIVRS